MASTPDQRPWVLLSPANVRHRSGGNVYNSHLVDALRALGRPVDVRLIEGQWPVPDDHAAGRIRAAADGFSVVIVDGLIGFAVPAAMQDLRQSGARTALLAHMLQDGPDVPAADVVVCPSAWTAAQVRAADPSAPVLVARPGVVRSGVARRGLAGSVLAGPNIASTGDRQLVCVGPLTAVKNQQALIEALGGLRDLRWSLLLVGADAVDPAYAAAVREAIHRLALSDRVRIRGQLDEAGMEALWRRVDLLVMVSQQESFGMVVIEALAHGVPAVVPAETGAVEALCGPPTGTPMLSYPSADEIAGAVVRPSELRAVLREWLTSDEIRLRWARAAACESPTIPGWAGTAQAVLDAVEALT